MKQPTQDQRRKISNFMRTLKRQARALEARRYPRAIINTRTYIEDFNQLNRSPYRQRVTLDFMNT